MRYRNLKVCRILLLLGVSYATASFGFVMTDEERALLPAYCKHQKSVSERHYNVPRSAQWEAYLGKNFNDIHHYCWALVNIGRSYKRDVGTMRGTLLMSAVGDIDYILRASADVPDFPLRAEALTHRGNAFLLLGRIKEAEASFATAREVNPAYARSYVLWAMYLHQNSKSAQALNIVEEGLKHAPDAKALISLRDELTARPRKAGSK